MAMERYNPTARASSRQMPSNGATPGNLGQGDPVNGYPFGSTTPGYTDYRNPANNGPFYQGTTRQQYNDDPNARKLHSPGSSRGEQSGFRPPTPSQGGPVGTPESDAAWEEMRQRTEREAFARRGMPFSNMQEWKDSDPQYVALRDAFKNATDPRAKAQALKAANDYDTRRQMQFKSGNARNAFIAQGGQGSTWDNRFSDENNWPRPTSSIGYSHGPGRPDFDTRATNPSPYGPGNTAPGVRRGATPQANAPMSAGAPPMQNPMMQGYQAGGFMGGGPGVPTGGGWGPGGGMQPWATTGNPYAGRGSGETGYMYGGGMMPGPMMQNSEAGLFSGLFGGGQMGSGETGMMYPGGGMPQGGNPFGGYSRPGYSPFDSGNYSMPYDNGGMWQMFGGSPMGGGRGMNYAQMQNYLGVQPQGAPNWIGL